MTVVLPPAVSAAWGVSDAVALPGGQGDALRAGDLVFKPAPEVARSAWLAGVLAALDPGAGIRVTRPVPSSSGEWVVDGWCAWRWLEGEHRPGMWSAVLEASSRFHTSVERVPWSPALVGADRWAIADRAAWGEAAIERYDAVASLVGLRRPVDLPAQLIHGDLAGNVLFHHTMAPAVIDVSPYWRPTAYADAIVVADAVAWGEARNDLVEEHLHQHGPQLLIRAVLFRVASDPDHGAPYGPLVEMLTS